MAKKTGGKRGAGGAGGSGDDAKLGRELLGMYNDLTELIRVTADKDRCKELSDQQDRIWNQIADLVDTNIDKASEEYQEATAALVEASASIQKALQGMEAVVKAIETVSKAVDLVAKVIA